MSWKIHVCGRYTFKYQRKIKCTDRRARRIRIMRIKSVIIIRSQSTFAKIDCMDWILHVFSRFIKIAAIWFVILSVSREFSVNDLSRLVLRNFPDGRKRRATYGPSRIYIHISLFLFFLIIIFFLLYISRNYRLTWATIKFIILNVFSI